MKFTLLKIPEVIEIEPEIFEDNRGFFFESFNQKKFNKLLNNEVNFVQDNHSKSSKGVLRGLHYQLPPFAQAKLIRVISGEIYDVAVDIRDYSETFGQWVSSILSSKNKKQLWIPEGFAHGFLVLSDSAEVLYKTTQYYSPKHEVSIHWKNNNYDINWPISNLSVQTSEKDSNNANR